MNTAAFITKPDTREDSWRSHILWVSAKASYKLWDNSSKCCYMAMTVSYGCIGYDVNKDI